MNPPLGFDPLGPSSRKRSTLFWVLVAVGCVFALGFCFRVGQSLYLRLRPPPEVEIPPTLVEVIQMSPTVFERTIPISGTLAPEHSTHRCSRSAATDSGSWSCCSPAPPCT